MSDKHTAGVNSGPEQKAKDAEAKRQVDSFYSGIEQREQAKPEAIRRAKEG